VVMFGKCDLGARRYRLLRW